MTLLRPLVVEPLTIERRAQLPAFVRKFLEDLILDDCQFEETEAQRLAKQQECEESALYAEVDGTIDHPYQDVSKQVNLWIADHDNVRIHLHIGGSACWIEPSNHSLFFRPITPDLLSETNQFTWWVVTEGYIVIRITIRAEHEVQGDFPDIG